VRVNPSDFERLREAPPPAAGGGQYQLISDPAIGQGGCVIETSLCTIDATFRVLFEEVARELLRGDPQADPVLGPAITQLGLVPESAPTAMEDHASPEGKPPGES
ncbi:MAG: hypothetical protein KGR26_14065, partial [Cyanobacteria bacterium REEB65]|nr:hypothetical protein [Cyanobacteria bacterium REEB65]